MNVETDPSEQTNDPIPSNDGRTIWKDTLDYDLPKELIAQQPARSRSDARLLVVDRARGNFEHQRIVDLPNYLTAGDLVVVNDSRVFRARLIGHKPSGGRVEVLLLDAQGESARAMTRTSKSLRLGARIDFTSGVFANVVEELGRGRVRLDVVGTSVEDLISRIGETPLPPYIERSTGPSRDDESRYQTVYAKERGSVAAPTAGLHLSETLIDEIRRRGAEWEAITLHVGPGTFTPVRGKPSDHKMESESYQIPASVPEAFRRCRRREGAGVVAIGTTTVRALESSIGHDGEPRAGQAESDLFIRPGYRFRAVDALLTNFHLPHSTLLSLVGAFAGEALLREAYEIAVAERYRFYSYGDAMLIV